MEIRAFIFLAVTGTLCLWAEFQADLCMGNDDSSVYVDDPDLNENPNPPAMLGRLEENVLGMRK